MHKKAKKLTKVMMAKDKKMNPYEKKMGHKVGSAAHKNMVSKKSDY